MRFRITELLVFTAVVAGAFACMRDAQYFSTGIFVNVVLAMLLMALLMAISDRGESKYFWIGFAVSGLLYSHYSELMFSVEYRGRLITESTFLNRIFEWSHPHEGSLSVVTGGGGFGGGGGLRNSESYKTFVQSGHGLITCCLAWFGGHFAKVVHEKSKPTVNKSVVT